MNANEVNLIINIFLNDDKSKVFTKKTKDLISLDIIKKEAMAYFEMNEQDINSFKLINTKSEDIKNEEDLINYSVGQNDENLICDARLLLSDKLNVQSNGETKKEEKKECKNNNNSYGNDNSIEINKILESKEVPQKKEENLPKLQKGENKKDAKSPMINKSNDTNVIKSNINTITGQDFTKKADISNNGETLPEPQIKENIDKNQELSRLSVEKNVGGTKPQGLEKNNKEDSLTDIEKIIKMNNSATKPIPSQINNGDGNDNQKEKDSKIPKNENAEKLKEGKNNLTLTEIEIKKNENNSHEGNINNNTNQLSDTNQNIAQSGEIIPSMQNKIEINSQEAISIINPTDYEKIKEDNKKLKEDYEILKKELEKIKEDKIKEENNKIKEIEQIKEKFQKENEELKAEKDLFENQRKNISDELNEKIEEFNKIDEDYKAKIKKLEEENSMLKTNKKEVKNNEEKSKKLSESKKIKNEEEISISDYKIKIYNLEKENEKLKKEKESIENKYILLEKENKNILQNKETKNDINDNNIFSNLITEKNELNNSKRKSFDFRNTKLFNEIKIGESNHNENDQASISKLTLTNDNLRKFLNQKDEKIKKLENKIKELEASKELKNTNKIENKEILVKKGEQGKLKSENKNNDINDNNKKEQDKKEVNEKIENKKDDIKEENININKDSYILEILKKVNIILDYDVKIYEKLNKEKNQPNEVGETDEKKLGHPNDNNENKNNQNNQNNQNLNNIIDNSNYNITSSGDTPIEIHENNNQENKTNSQEFETCSIFNHEIKDEKNNNINIRNELNGKKIKTINPSRNVQNNIKNNLNNNNSKKNNQNESANKTIDKEKYINEFEKLKNDVPDLIKYFSKDYILEILSKNNGDSQKTSNYLFDYLVSNENKRK